MNATVRREKLLRQLNARLPPGIDWKAGAASYHGNLVKSCGEHVERYHLVKPFIGAYSAEPLTLEIDRGNEGYQLFRRLDGASDFVPFTSAMYRFVNIVARLPLNERSRILDIGCGPGWVSHYFAKLGLDVLGIDISQELLDIAERRLKGDLYPPYGPQWSARFALHDIEAAPLHGEKPFDVAVFESVLHHFHDPVAALENTAACLSEGALMVIIEAEAPEPGTRDDLENQKLMREYHTIERPYTRAELDEMLDIAGFGWRKYYYPINGWFEQTNEHAVEVFHLLRGGTGYNFAIAARSRQRFEEVFRPERAESGLRALARRLSYAIGRRFLNLNRRLRRA